MCPAWLIHVYNLPWFQSLFQTRSCFDHGRTTGLWETKVTFSAGAPDFPPYRFDNIVNNHYHFLEVEMRFLIRLFSGRKNVMRSNSDRRAGEDRRKESICVTYSARKFERRLNTEKRKNWTRISIWSSRPLESEVSNRKAQGRRGSPFTPWPAGEPFMAAEFSNKQRMFPYVISLYIQGRIADSRQIVMLL